MQGVSSSPIVSGSTSHVDVDPRGGAAPGRAGRDVRGRRSPAVRWVVLALSVAAAVVAGRTLPLDEVLLDLVAWVRAAGPEGVAVFVASYVLATVLFVPGSILTLGAGFAYGVALGTPIVWVAANLGAAIAFALGRTVARRSIAARVAGDARFAAVDRAVARRGLGIVILARLSPMLPFNLLNYAFGLTRVRLRDYVLGSLIGMLPGTLLYVYLGSLVTTLGELASGLPGAASHRGLYFAGLALTAAVTVHVTRVARRALDEAMLEREAATPAEPAGERVDRGARLLADDESDRALVAQVRPPRWRNPEPTGRYDLVVVGGGTAGLVSAAGGAGLGAKVALVERHLLGGDCLNAGCVPSKALLHAARLAAEARGAEHAGVRVADVVVDFPAVMSRMRGLRARIAPNDGATRLAGLGVDVFLGEARFVGPRAVEVDGRRLEFARAVIATGARPSAPEIPGLAEAGYLSNESIFALTELPARLVVIGAGPVGCEMAQAFARFGSRVTLLRDGERLLPGADADAAAIVERQLVRDGVAVVGGARVTRVERRVDERVVAWERAGERAEATCDQILVATGRVPNVDGLGLAAAGVDAGPEGVVVDDFLRTTNRRIHAAGDVASRWKFTHAADALARIVLANALFLGRRRASALHVPWCVYTSPEVAHVGLDERQANERGVPVDTLTVPFADVDRAVLDDDDGFLRVHVKRGGDRIVGATLVGRHAGETISELTLAMEAGIGLGRLASVIHPYPTEAEAIRKAADAYNRTRLTPRVKRLIAAWLRLRR